MTTRASTFGRGRPDFGIGISMPPDALPPEPQSAIYKSFRDGLDLSDAPEDVSAASAVFAVDMEIGRNDRILRAPGVGQITEEAHSLYYTFQQASIDFNVELVAIDPPWLGYKGSAGWIWVNLALTATGNYQWVALNYLGDLLFSNGSNASYSRAPSASVVTNQTANIIARTFAQQFGRIFAGYYTVGGAAQALGVKWNDTTALIGGWGGTGAGSELLLSDDTADHVVAIRALGFDTLAILNRNSLWAGLPTGRSTRPADFRLRFGGVGCVNERTARVTPGGVTFLSDEGVVHYTVNDYDVISNKINPELIPIDFFNITKYSAAYIPGRRRYYLATPRGIYIYEFPVAELNRPGRWMKRSAIVDQVIAFAAQSAVVTWDSLVGSWDALVGAWDTLSGGPAPALPFFTLGGKFGQEDPALDAAFGQAMNPRWRTPQGLQEAVTDQITTVGWEVAYAAPNAASINLVTSDSNNNFVNSVTKNLPSTGSSDVIRKKLMWAPNGGQTGMGVQTQVEITSGRPEILRIRQLFIPSGPATVSVGA
jgi:hypothetical protein